MDLTTEDTESSEGRKRLVRRGLGIRVGVGGVVGWWVDGRGMSKRWWLRCSTHTLFHKLYRQAIL